MEHIVHLGINIDDEAIRKAIEKNAEAAIIKELETDIKKVVFRDTYYGVDTDRMSPYIAHKIDELLESHKDTIIILASEKLAERLSKTKKCRDAVDKVLEDM